MLFVRLLVGVVMIATCVVFVHDALRLTGWVGLAVVVPLGVTTVYAADFTVYGYWRRRRR